MGLSISSSVLWALSEVLEACLCLLILLRGANKRLPLLTAYLLFQIFANIAGWAIMRELGFWSSAYYYVSWVNSGALMIGTWLVTAELCHRGFRAYRGIWAMTWRLLLALFVLFLLDATYDASKHANKIGALIVVLQRDLAMASAVILIAILIIE